MIDPFGRTISYLRVSVTDRCGLPCVYCMTEHMVFLPKSELLTLEELDRLCRASHPRGVKKFAFDRGRAAGCDGTSCSCQQPGAARLATGLRSLRLTNQWQPAREIRR